VTRIAFYAQHLSERGTGVALYDYALENRRLLGNDSLVLYERDSPHNNPAMVARFEATFPTVPVPDFAAAETVLAAEGADALYVLKAGRRDGLLSRRVPTLVHAVFPTSTREVHGASYAFVSDWLARWCAGGRVPAVPHIARIGETDGDLRAELGLPAEALVLGCYGGRESFDIGFVRDTVIPRVLEELPQVHFLFMNIAPFADHPRMRFLPASVDLEEKTAFINSCDAMLHARHRGETFGMAVAEFSLRGKPVLTWAGSRERAHLEMLGPAAMAYRDARDLFARIAGFDRAAPSARDTYEREYSAAPVMARFDAQLIAPALAGAAPDAVPEARRRLGLRPWHAARLPLSKLGLH
jgi:hypothetical protein